MTRTRIVVRVIFLLLILSTFIFLLRNIDSNVINVAKFKVETFDKLKSDTLVTRQRIDLLLDATDQLDKKIAEDSSSFKSGVYSVIGILVLWLGAELAFAVSARMRTRQP